MALSYCKRGEVWHCRGGGSAGPRAGISGRRPMSCRRDAGALGARHLTACRPQQRSQRSRTALATASNRQDAIDLDVLDRLGPTMPRAVTPSPDRISPLVDRRQPDSSPPAIRPRVPWIGRLSSVGSSARQPRRTPVARTPLRRLWGEQRSPHSGPTTTMAGRRCQDLTRSALLLVALRRQAPAGRHRRGLPRSLGPRTARTEGARRWMWAGLNGGACCRRASAPAMRHPAARWTLA